MVSYNELLIPIFGIVFSFVTPIAIILIVFLNKTKQEKYRNEVLKAAIEQGRELPADFFKQQVKPKENLLRTSTFFLAFGIGIGIFFYFFFAGQGEGLKFASIGLIFIFIGIGRRHRSGGLHQGLSAFGNVWRQVVLFHLVVSDRLQLFLR